jgi:hypothetical protein
MNSLKGEAGLLNERDPGDQKFLTVLVMAFIDSSGCCQ